MPSTNGNRNPDIKRTLSAEEQIATGTVAIKLFAEKAMPIDTNNVTLACMAVTLIDVVNRADRLDLTDRAALRLSVGYAMLGAYLYGQYAGAKIEGARRDSLDKAADN